MSKIRRTEETGIYSQYSNDDYHINYISIKIKTKIKVLTFKDFLVVSSRLNLSMAGDIDFILVRELRSHMLHSRKKKIIITV